MKTFLSGVKPTGRPHIGNYFGAMKQFVDFQNTHDGGYVMIADFHAINHIQDKQEMHDNIIGVMLDYLAIGLDPEKLIMFKQSDISEHFELTWIFDAITTMPYLMRAHAFKDAEAKNKEISVGTFNYPLLMAADILLYGPDVVPVGKDQQQHVEIARDTAEKFNRIFKSDVFKLPNHAIISDVATVPGTDGQKMSKSYNNTIPLFASDEEIKKAVMSIVTDSGSEIPKNVYAIHALIKSKPELDALYEANKGKYKALKDALVEDLITFIAPLRERRKEFENDIPKVIEMLKQGGLKAKAIASKKMEEVRESIGVEL
ncbi:MAG: tryptophan--tRNA ligase [Candidatus Paceibacterota bacterium]|jgi:tryptophanyl-tRNA synthetase